MLSEVEEVVLSAGTLTVVLPRGCVRRDHEIEREVRDAAVAVDTAVIGRAGVARRVVVVVARGGGSFMVRSASPAVSRCSSSPTFHVSELTLP
jgi:hypothetical protein